jgi:hypothetical protein
VPEYLHDAVDALGKSYEPFVNSLSAAKTARKLTKRGIKKYLLY